MTPKEIAKELNRILAREVYAADAFAVAMRRLADRIEAEEDVFAPNTTLPEDWRAHIRALRARAEKAEGERPSAWDECKRLEVQVRVARVERVKAEARVAELTEIIRDAFDKATASRYTDSANVVMECLQ